MTDPSIPILAYAFIGITTLVLAYATIMDTEPIGDATSATSLLPSFSSQQPTTTSSTAQSIPIAQQISNVSTNVAETITNPFGKSPPQLKIGGKTKRRHINKHKKTKSKPMKR
jgi:hypothetical protein